MNRVAQYILIGFLMNMGASLETQAATRTAADCSNSAIQSAINSAANGDTVSVPTGNCTWNGSVTIPSTKGITLQGSGTIDSNGNYSSSGTYIRLGAINGLVVQTKPSGNSPVRITGFYFTHTDPSSSNAVITMQGQTGAYRNGSTNWRIDHNYFNYAGPNGGANAASPGVRVQGWTYGLIDHNVFNHQGRALFIEMGSDDFELTGYYGDGSWDTNRGGPIDWGGAQAVYIEENWAYGDQSINSNQFIESHRGARIVMRYNRIEDMQIQSHSGCSNHGRSTLHQEIYNNTFVSHTSSNTTYSALFIRGGTFVFHNNTIIGTYASPNPYFIDYQHGTDGCNACGAPTPYVNGVCTWPCVDQIGTGADASGSGRRSSPVYAWNNFQNGSPITIVKGQCGANDILEGRDYFNNKVMPGYSPYTYPHPLSVDGIQSLAAPANLRIMQY